MANPLRCLFALLLFVLVLLIAVEGCGKSGNGEANKKGPGAGAGDFRFKGKGRGRGPEEDDSGIRIIMAKLAKGPESLTTVLGTELKLDPPPWEALQAQTKQFSELTIELGGFGPPKGSKESWAKLTAEFARAASDMNRAAQAEDKEAALEAHDKITNSCIVCHKEHKGNKG